MPRTSKFIIIVNCRTKIAPQHLDTDERDKKILHKWGGRPLLKLFSLTGTVSTSPNLAKERARRASKQFLTSNIASFLCWLYNLQLLLIEGRCTL